MSSSIGGVSFPVNVFCWLGWKQPSSWRSPTRRAPWVKRGRGLGMGSPDSARNRSAASHAKAPRQTITRACSSNASSRTANGRQRSRSAGVGLLAGGAQRTAAVTQQSSSASPSSAAVELGWLANPVRCSAANRKSPERSPVKTRPVRLAPCAAGARPSSTTRAPGSPNPGIGRPQ
jgi:hypothetical protein